ncbi:MAG: hypothetical protein KF810_06360 [Rhizobiaceae bacterium]|nr:hypothetical protein [Rhizobiaceae bacterium]
METLAEIIQQAARPVTRRAVLGGMLGGCLSLAGCGEQWSWNEKIMAEVQTPDGVVTGSSVIRRTLVDNDSSFAPPEARGASSNVSGEAAVVEVTPGRYLFVLLKDLPSPFSVFFPGEAPVEVASRFETLRGTREVPRDQYPLLVTFTDIDDPTTVQRVDPDNLAATFGPGVSLRRITLEITDEKVTERNIKKLLPWLGEYPEPKLGPATGGTSNIPFYRHVSYGDLLRK